MYIEKEKIYSLRILFLFSSRSRSKGKLVSNGHGSPTKKEKSHSCSPKNDIIDESASNSKTS